MYALVVGGGLAGAECAWQLGQRGHEVRLFEMRPACMTPAHRTDLLAELVCSNSLRGKGLGVAVGVLKEELRLLGSLIIEAASSEEIPGGNALVVDRESFSRRVTEMIRAHPRIELVREEVSTLPEEGVRVVATGPLTSASLSENLKAVVGRDYLYFFDAASPVVTAESLDMDPLYFGSRYGKGESDSYLNVPLDRALYYSFQEALAGADTYPLRDFESEHLFEGCLPVEEMARRGRDTLRFGPLKPVGLPDPRTGEIPYAVVQLRPENRRKTLFSLVGFQTNLTRSAQRRVLRMLPGLTSAQFERYGMMHRNTFINAPRNLLRTMEHRRCQGLFFAGQVTGSEGYVESAATGLLAGINASRRLAGENPVSLPRETVLGSLCYYLETANPENFQPMNASFGLVPPLDKRIRGRRARREALGRRALDALQEFTAQQRLREDRP